MVSSRTFASRMQSLCLVRASPGCANTHGYSKCASACDLFPAHPQCEDGSKGCCPLPQGFGDAQLYRLTAVLLRRRIWSLNVGENFQVSLGAWQQFAVRHRLLSQ